jgi:hypothetical protein
MSHNDTAATHRPHGTFAEGQADRSRSSAGSRIGRFSDGLAEPVAGMEAGRFSEG